MNIPIQRNEVSVVQKGGIFDKVIHQARKKIHNRFMDTIKPQRYETILDVGASGNPAFVTSNYLEFSYPMLNITALGLEEETENWKIMYPSIKYIKGNALNLPFDTNSFDIVYSHAVIEHVGNFCNQVSMISECMRVARRAIWITTPNRWHPIEFHTIIPFIHWLPKKMHRALLKKIGYDYFSSENILNLLDTKELSLATQAAHYHTSENEFLFKFIDIYKSKFIGMTGHLLLYIHN